MNNSEQNILVDEIMKKLHTKKIYLKEAVKILEKAEQKALEIKVPVTIAIVDDGGNLICQHRMDNAILASIELSNSKAYTANALKCSTDEVSKKVLPNQELYGLQNTHLNKFCLFGGGIPIVKDGNYIGAIGVSGGSVEEDILIAKFAIS